MEDLSSACEVPYTREKARITEKVERSKPGNCRAEHSQEPTATQGTSQPFEEHLRETHAVLFLIRSLPLRSATSHLKPLQLHKKQCGQQV